MNIAIFSPSKNPYSETFIQAHKQYLKDKVFYYYGKKNSIKLEGVPFMVSRLKLQQLRLLRLLKAKTGTYINDQQLLISLRKNQVDVVLVEYGTHAYNLLSILEISKIPFVVHFHGYDASVTSTIERCKSYKDVFKSASKIIAVSKMMEAKLLAIGCPEDKLVHNVYGPQPEFEAIIPTFSKKQFVAIGRFTEKKAPYYTILAFKEVLSKHPDAMMVMAGNGELWNMCKNIIKHFKLEDNVTLLGVITPEEFRNILETSLALVQHSITTEDGDMEGTPLAVLEASAAGLPVISTNHAGIPDVIKHQQTGLLSNEHDVDTMSKHMLLLLDNWDYAKRLGEAGKRHIITHFSMERHINVLQEVLEKSVN